MTEHEIRDAMSDGVEQLHARTSKAKAAIEDVADKVASSVDKIGDRASDAVTKLSDEAIDAYDRAYASARKVGEAVEPFVRDRPYAALGIAAAVGLIAGLLLTGRGPKVVYVRPSR